MEKVVEVTHLYKKYKESEDFALKDLSFTVQKGEIYGVLGTNGAGKTTLMSILMGGIQPTAGNFTISGLSYKGQAQQIRYKIGVVPQEYALYPTLRQGKISIILLAYMDLRASKYKSESFKDWSGLVF